MADRSTPKPGDIYLHFKGNYYFVLCIAKHTETAEKLVIYRGRDNSKVYARPLTMFMSPVDRNKHPNATQKWRFELQKFGANNV